MRCVLVGNYGVQNIGDEALKEYFLQAFPEIVWTVVSARPHGPREVPRIPLGFRSLFRPWWRTLAAIARADALVFGGGSLFTDIESVWACVIWRTYAVVASLFGTPYFLAFQGAGPWKTRLGERLARKTYQSASFISVRDQKSLDRIAGWNCRAKPVLTSDPAVALFAKHPKTEPVGRRLVLIPRANSGDAFFAAVKRSAEAETWESVRILLMQPDAAERGVAARLQSIVPSASVIEIRSVEQLLDEVAMATKIVTQRYHGALAAFAMGIAVEIVPQGEGDKLSVLRTAAQVGGLGLGTWLELVENGAVALRDAVGFH